MTVKTLTRAIDQINLRIGQGVAWLCLAMVLLTTVDVLLRYLFNTGAVWIQELEWHLFGLVFLLCAGYTLLKDGHVRVDLFYSRLSRGGKAWVDLLGTVILLFPVCALVIWSSHKFIANSWGFQEGSADPGGLPARYLIKGVIPVGFVLLALQGVSEALKNLLVLAESEEQG